MIGLIVTMVVLSALGAAMVSLTSTSMFGQVGANSSARAYYLAESGFRYAEKRYMAASDKGSELENMHDQTLTLLNDAGRFNLKVFPYYFRITTNPVGTSSLSAKVPGGFPAGVTISNGRLKIGSRVSSTYNYSAATQAGQNVTFNMSQVLPYFPVNTDVLPVAVSDSTSQVISAGDALLLAADTADIFPQRNGTFSVNDHIYAYRENDRTNNRLLGISDPSASGAFPLTVAPNSDIILQKFAELQSVGEYGQGAADAAASREITYHIPLPAAAEERKGFQDSFTDTANWQTSTIGSFAVQTIGGDSALRVIATETLGGTPKASLIRFDPSEANIDLEASYRYGDPYFLSYDAQVKVGFDASPTPDYGFDPVPIPVYYAAGLLFRLDNNNNSYGLSFLRGSSSTFPTPDNIDDGMVPQDKKSLIVLWQQTDSGATTKWLAYKDINVFFTDTIERGENGWTSTGLWHQSARKPYSPTTSWYYGQEASGNYNTGARNVGSLTSPGISLCQAVNPVLTFRSWYQTEPDNLILTPPPSGINEANYYDRKHVEISTDDGNSWNPLFTLTFPTNQMNTWEQITIPLSAYSGQTIKIRFRFDTIDAVSNGFEGWYVDDIIVSGTSSFPLNEATLMVRVREAASVSFTGGGPVAIEDGDIVVGQTSGGRGTVFGASIHVSGSWGGNTAAGTLLLRNTSGTFGAGEQINVIGSAATAQVDGYSARDNYIRAYYGDQTGCGTPNSDPLDSRRGAIPRGTIYWPPDEVAGWDAAGDYFTLVQWDAVNTGVTLISSKSERNAIVRDNTLTSPSSGPLLQPELGLHAFGKGAANTYFDDFGVQADIGTSGNTGFVRTLQE